MNRIVALLIFLQITIMCGQSPWPSGSWSSAVNLTGTMDAAGITDLSGLHWNPLTNCLYCIQGDGHLRVLQLNTVSNMFSQLASKVVPDGPEGITQVSFSANEFYTIDENNYEIRKFTHNASFANMTEARHWNLLASPSPMTNTGNSGPEGIVFVPDSFLTAAGFVSQATGTAYTSVKGMGGLMFVAHQDGGYIWVFDINPNVNNDFVYVGKYKTNRAESCDLSFDRSTGMLYILHNITGNNKLEVTDLSTTLLSGNQRKFVVKSEYYITNPGDGNDNIEGIAITPKCPDTNTVNVWLCRDVESSEDDAVQQDAIRMFSPFASAGSCTALTVPDFAQADNVRIFPNPGNGLMTLAAANPLQNASIRILNSLGQVVVKKEHCTGIHFVFDLTVLQNGLYFFEINQGEVISRLKWMKN